MSTLPAPRPGKIYADGHVTKRPKDGYASQVEERLWSFCTIHDL